MDQHPVKHGLLISVDGSHAKHCLKVGRNGVDAGFGVGVRITVCRSFRRGRLGAAGQTQLARRGPASCIPPYDRTDQSN
jgi:hypothetical protein